MLCRVCDGGSFRLVVDLKEQPWGNHFLQKEEVGKEEKYPLRVIYCNQCSTVQLDYTVKKEVMFSDHTYLSGMTQTLRDHFDKEADKVDRRFFFNKQKKRVLDIGSNDGTQLLSYKKLGYEVVGVESSKRAVEIANSQGVFTVHDFFNYELAKKMEGSLDVINAAGVFFHLEELHSVCEGIQYLLQEKGVFVIQCMYLKNIVENIAFDQIYHEHLLYYTIHSLNTLLQKHGLILFDVEISPIHGGSLIAYASHKNAYPISSSLKRKEEEERLSGCNTYSYYQKFAQNIESLKEKNLQFFEKRKQEKKVIYGMGAPVKGNTLLNYFGIGTDYITCLVEKNPLRKGLYSPGMHIPIVLEEKLEVFPDVYYVLAWNFKKEILKKNRPLIEKGVEFYFPIGGDL